MDVAISVYYMEYTLCYKDNSIRTKALILGEKNEEKSKSFQKKVRLTVPQNVRTKCLGQNKNKLRSICYFSPVVFD